MKLRFSGTSRSEKESIARKRRWRRWLLVMVAVPVLISLGVGGFVGYNYWEYRTFWGDPNVRPSDVTNFGTVQTKTFNSEALDETMEYEIYLPPGYDDFWHRFAHYPVVYLLHGRPGTADDWNSKGGAPDAMDTLLARGQVQPMIVVMPQGSRSRFAPSTGYVDASEGNWGTYITHDLVNEVDSNYRTVESANGRAIAGNSEGGYAAMNLGLQNPSEFGVIGSFSGYFTADEEDKKNLFDGDQNFADANSPAIYLPQLEGVLPAIYLLIGQDDKRYLDENSNFAEQLKSKGVSLEFDPAEGRHSWDLWRGHMPDFLTFAGEHLR